MHTYIIYEKPHDILSMVAYLIGKQTLYTILKRPLVFMVQCKKQLTALNNNNKKR